MHRRSFLKALGGSAIALGSATKIAEALALEPLPIAKEPWGNAFVLEIFHQNEWKAILGVINLTLMHQPIEITSHGSDFREFIDGSYSVEINGMLSSMNYGETLKLLEETFFKKGNIDARMATLNDGILFEKAKMISYDVTVSHYQPTMARIELSYEKYTTTRLED